MRFKKSKIYLSIIPVVTLGFGIGILTSIMGVGGGFIMVPAMIYLLRIPTNVVVGTSLFQIIFVTAYTTIVQAATNYSVDVVLAFILMVAGVIGAQYGVRVGQKLRGEQLRALFGASGACSRPSPCRGTGCSPRRPVLGRRRRVRLLTHRLLLCAFLLIGSCLAFTASAQTPPLALPPGTQQRSLQENIEIGASTTEIPITSDFRGADFTLFGALNNTDQLLLAIGQYDIVVTLEGPSDYMTVRKKGAWPVSGSIQAPSPSRRYRNPIPWPARAISAPSLRGTLRGNGAGCRTSVAQKCGVFRRARQCLRFSGGLSAPAAFKRHLSQRHDRRAA